VKQQLKSPSTAKFSSETVSSLGGGTSNIDGVVDSENSYGAVLRGTFGCQLTNGSMKVMYVNG
jgi:hypothetical protein